MTDKPRRHSASHINLREESTPRLTLIAPKAERGLHHGGQVSPGIRRPRSANGITKTKAGLPPRSRTGCWTCRTRKVKCDEGHPRCGQCARLQHDCDYSPRLSFRDDTPRIIERMQEVSTTGSVVWDESVRRRGSFSLNRNSLELSLELQRDPESLPPFSELTNDEERELKALTRLPGTYHLICNPSSFTAIDEGPDGSEEGSEGPPSILVKRESFDNIKVETPSEDSLLGQGVRNNSNTIPVDPDVVILKKFEEPITKLAAMIKVPTTVTESDVFAVNGDSNAFQNGTKPEHDGKDGQAALPDDTKYYQYYKDSIVPQLTDIRGFGNVWGIDLQQGESFERAARDFPPLFHAMLALAAFSKNRREGTANLDSLQYYQLALPALQSSLLSADDLMSDGMLFTHFFLLLYEIAAVETGRESMWQQHLQHIKSIVLSRPKRRPSNDANLFVIWYIFVLEVYTSLSAGTEGDFAELLLKENLVPDGVSLFNTNWSDDGDQGLLFAPSFVDTEIETYRQLISLNRMLLISGNAIAKTSAAIKNAAPSTGYVLTDGQVISSEQVDLSWRQTKMLQNVEELQTVWLFHRNHLADLDLGTMEYSSSRVRMMYAQAALFYQMCILYTYTSMWPGQRAYLDADTSMEIETSIQTIIRDAQTIAGQKDVYQSLGFMGFPLFLAGVMSSSESQRIWVLELLSIIEAYSIGRNVAALRQALQVVHQHQSDALMSVGHCFNVEWQDIIGGLGVHVVSFGI